MSMQWSQLLSATRLGKCSEARHGDQRTAFERDFDRIIFSAAFRRLQNKTQVFPLARNDYVRTRLTHSLEAASVGRSLGTLVGHKLLERDPALAHIFQPHQLGSIVATACLAHDIGNPPFGHAGEDAISHWFCHEPCGQQVVRALQAEGAVAEDFTRFEGNAQGFRVLTRLERNRDPGGMQLTLATLAAFLKYPRSATVAAAIGGKHGFFAADQQLFADVAEGVGLLPDAARPMAFCRHPLGHLVEAADDICYHIVDIEDGWRIDLLDFAGARDLLVEVAEPAEVAARLEQMQPHCHDQIEYLRARAISALINQVVEVFIANSDAIMTGKLTQPLTALIPQAAAFQRLKQVAVQHVYHAREVLLIEVAGYNVLGKLMEIFVNAFEEKAQARAGASALSSILWQLFADKRQLQLPATLYERLLLTTDFVSSMTDRDAVSLFKRLTGISLTED